MSAAHVITVVSESIKITPEELATPFTTGLIRVLNNCVNSKAASLTVKCSPRTSRLWNEAH